jgi:hypothetical protein
MSPTRSLRTQAGYPTLRCARHGRCAAQLDGSSAIRPSLRGVARRLLGVLRPLLLALAAVLEHRSRARQRLLLRSELLVAPGGVLPPVASFGGPQPGAMVLHESLPFGLAGSSPRWEPTNATIDDTQDVVQQPAAPPSTGVDGGAKSTERRLSVDPTGRCRRIAGPHARHVEHGQAQRRCCPLRCQHLCEAAQITGAPVPTTLTSARPAEVRNIERILAHASSAWSAWSFKKMRLPTCRRS